MTIEVPDAPEATDGAGFSKSRWALTALAALLALGCVLLPVAKAFFPSALPSSWNAADRADDRNDEVIDAARKVMRSFTNTDYQTIDKDIARTLALSTGEFKKEFAATEVQYEALSRQSRAVATGSVREIGITRSNDDEAMLSVAVDQKVLNQTVRQALAKGEKVDNNRTYLFQVTLSRVGEKWLLSQLEVIG